MSVSKFKTGNRVVCPKNPNLGDNKTMPHWGGKYGYVAGTITAAGIDPDGDDMVTVMWDNGSSSGNTYASRLKHYHTVAKYWQKIEARLGPVYHRALSYRRAAMFVVAILVVCYFLSKRDKFKASAKSVTDGLTSKVADKIADKLDK